MSGISRRSVLGTLAGSAALAMAGAEIASGAEPPTVAVPKLRNEDFYDAAGQFNAAAAKEAYYAMMRRFNYPIVDRLKTDDFWVLDFGMGNFLEAGMAGIFWVNNKEHNYFGHEIYLLPGQAIPEHKHLKTDMPAKMEGWQPRHGFIYTFAEGTATAGVDDLMPPMHREVAHARACQMLKTGQVAGLAAAEQWHFMKAGPEGAIVTEYGTYHDMAGLRFSHPKAKV